MGKRMLAGGAGTAAASAVAVAFLPAGAPLLLFLGLLGVFVGVCLAMAGAWQWYAEGRETPPVAWRWIAVSVAVGFVVAVTFMPWLGRGIIPPLGVLVAAAVGAVTMYAAGGRNVGHSLWAGLLAGCAYVLGMAAFWFAGAAA